MNTQSHTEQKGDAEVLTCTPKEWDLCLDVFGRTPVHSKLDHKELLEKKNKTENYLCLHFKYLVQSWCPKL